MIRTMLPWAFLIMLLAFFGSFALANLCLFGGLGLGLADREVRRRAREAIPEGLACAATVLACVFLVSLACSAETWEATGSRNWIWGLRPLFALAFGIVAGTADPTLWHRSLWFACAIGALFVLPTVPTWDGTRLELAKSVYGREILGANVLGGILGHLLLVASAATMAAGRASAAPALWIRLLLMAGLLLGQFLTASRAAMLMVMVGMVMLGLLGMVGRQTRILFLLVLAAVAGVAIGNARFLRDRAGTSLTVGFRLFYWKRALGMIERAPLFGAGARRLDELGDLLTPPPPGTRAERFEQYARDLRRWDLLGNPTEFHNDFLTAAAAHGIPGLLAWLWFHAQIFLALVRSTRSGVAGSGPGDELRGYLIGSAATVAGLLAFMIGNPAWFNKEMGPYCYALLGLAIASAPRSCDPPVPAGEGGAPRAAP